MGQAVCRYRERRRVQVNEEHMYPVTYRYTMSPARACSLADAHGLPSPANVSSRDSACRCETEKDPQLSMAPRWKRGGDSVPKVASTLRMPALRHPL